MNLESVRALKAELFSEVNALSVVAAPQAARGRARALAAPGRLAKARAVVAYAATSTQKLDALPRTLALGVAPKGRRDYRLAVRLQRQSLVDSYHVERIRKKAKGEVDIRYIGRITKRAAYNQARHRPLRIGLSIGHYNITAGTLGAFVTRKGSGEVRMLSNNHVFADENRGKSGDAILQPGAYDGGKRPKDKVGTLAEFHRLTKSKNNLIDAALAAIDDGVDYVANGLKGHGELKGVLLDPTGITGTVEKIGRTTAHTRGRITAFEVNNVVVTYDMGNLRFDDQIEIEGTGTTGFSDGGDSGSLIFNTAGHLAIGLLFAGGDTGGSNGKGLTYANPIGHVLDDLKVDLLL